MSPEAAQLFDLARSVALVAAACALFGMLVLATILFPSVIEGVRARTRYATEATTMLPQIERDLASIARHGSNVEALLKQVVDGQRVHDAKLDAVVERNRRG